MRAMRAAVIFLGALVACASTQAIEARAVTAAAPTTLLPEGANFTSIVNCSPLALLIQPGPSYALDAHPAVVPTIEPATGALHLGVRAFNASTPVLLRVTLPADALRRVATSSGPVTVAPGFTPPTLTLVNTGPATLYVSGLANNASHVAVSNVGGTGAVVVDAAIRSASVEGAGSGASFIRGVSREVVVDLGGLARVAIEPATGDALVRGSTAGMASVQLTRGRCAVESENGSFFGPPCAPVPSPVRLPRPVTTWSCGLAVAVDGVLGCDATAGRNAVVVGGGGYGGGGNGGVVTTTGGGNGFISTSMGGGSSFVSSSSSSSGNGATFVSTGGGGGGNGGGVFMSSNGGGGTVLGGGGGNGGAFYTIGDDGSIRQAPVLRAPACTVTAEESKMTLA